MFSNIILPGVYLLLVALLSSCANASNYCAQFKASETRGATGYFSLSIKDGVAYYKPYVDLSKWDLRKSFEGTCDLSQLSFHIHSFWKNSTAGSTYGTTYCGASITGAHYDPNLACDAFSQSYGVCFAYLFSIYLF